MRACVRACVCVCVCVRVCVCVCVCNFPCNSSVKLKKKKKGVQFCYSCTATAALLPFSIRSTVSITLLQAQCML